MSLHEEERNEQNEQAWHTHFERERLDLSASVEAALMDDGVLVRQWQNGLDEQSTSQSVTDGTERVVSRLNVHSGLLSPVQPENRVPSTTDSHQVLSSHTLEEVEENSAPPSQHSGMLARLARRFTSSFAAVKPEMPHHQAELPPHAPSFSQDRETYSPALSTNGHLSVPITHYDSPLVRVINTVTPSDREEEERLRTESREHRWLKRNARVRLETTEQPAITKTGPSSQREELETGEALLAEVRDAMDRQQSVPVFPLQKEELESIQYNPLHSAAQSSLSGSGTFECEQSDVMILNSCITASSVVLVTLTTNPGPVVVQYISLQPEVGFTVHLTAPVATHTMFNYVILSGMI